MSYKYITKYDSKNYWKGGNKIEGIVIHHWGADGQKFDDVVRYLCNNNNDVSAHYVVEAGKVACIVDCKDRAWHAGHNWANAHTIGIECRPEMSDGDLKTLIELVANLYKEYGVLPLYGHKDFMATACPGRYYKKLDYIKKEAIKLMKPHKPVKVKKWYCSYITNGTMNLRKEMSTSSKILAKIPEGTKFVGNYCKGNWIRTNYKGKVGYVRMVATIKK